MKKMILTIFALALSFAAVAVTRDATKEWKKANWQENKAQWEQYHKDQDLYKGRVTGHDGWQLADVKKASEDGPTTACAAWPYVNLAYHIIKTDGDLSEASKALETASQIIGDFDGKDADQVRNMIAKNSKYIEGKQGETTEEKDEVADTNTN